MTDDEQQIGVLEQERLRVEALAEAGLPDPAAVAAKADLDRIHEDDY